LSLPAARQRELSENMTTLAEDDDFYKRRDSLRLEGFDYATRRVYFITIVVNGRRKEFLDADLAQATVDCLLDLRQQMGFKLYSYCLMPDHFHALISMGSSGKSLGEICGAFKSLTTRIFWRRQQGKLWQRQFFDHIIRNEEDFFETREYVWMNPARKGLVETPDEWRYSGRVDDV
jgi:putative transposase